MLLLKDLLDLLRSNYSASIQLTHNTNLQDFLNGRSRQLINFENIKNFTSDWIVIDCSQFIPPEAVLEAFEPLLKDGYMSFSYIYCDYFNGNRACYIYPSVFNKQLRVKIQKLLKLKVFS
jgi:hypothetical protein